jgi:DNA-directed RNA polymerase subunit L
MKITILELSSGKIRVSLAQQGHTFMNGLVTEILDDPRVDVANYLIEFQHSDPILMVTTVDGIDPIEVIMDACKKFSSRCDALIQELHAAQATA